MKMIMMFKKMTAILAVMFLLMSPAFAAAQEFEDDVEDEAAAPEAPVDSYIPVLIAGGALLGYMALKRLRIIIK